MEIMLAALVLLSLYLLEEQRMNRVADWVREFMEYLERQQQAGADQDCCS